MRRENPRTYRLSSEALQALERLAEGRGLKVAQVIEELALESDQEYRRTEILRRLENIEGRLTRLEENP